MENTGGMENTMHGFWGVHKYFTSQISQIGPKKWDWQTRAKNRELIFFLRGSANRKFLSHKVDFQVAHFEREWLSKNGWWEMPASQGANEPENMNRWGFHNNSHYHGRNIFLEG